MSKKKSTILIVSDIVFAISAVKAGDEYIKHTTSDKGECIFLVNAGDMVEIGERIFASKDFLIISAVAGLYQSGTTTFSAYELYMQIYEAKPNNKTLASFTNRLKYLSDKRLLLSFTNVPNAISKGENPERFKRTSFTRQILLLKEVKRIAREHLPMLKGLQVDSFEILEEPPFLTIASRSTGKGKQIETVKTGYVGGVRGDIAYCILEYFIQRIGWMKRGKGSNVVTMDAIWTRLNETGTAEKTFEESDFSEKRNIARKVTAVLENLKQQEIIASYEMDMKPRQAKEKKVTVVLE